MSAVKKDGVSKKAIQKPATRLQFGALTYRKTKTAGLEILLVTSRQTKRWVIPKGWPIKGLKPSASAAQEAYEEAGVRGKIETRSMGSYVYQKLLDNKAVVVPCEVRVFALRVGRQEKVWPEIKQRQTRWFAPDEAMTSVDEDELKALIARFAGLDVG